MLPLEADPDISSEAAPVSDDVVPPEAEAKVEPDLSPEPANNAIDTTDAVAAYGDGPVDTPASVSKHEKRALRGVGAHLAKHAEPTRERPAEPRSSVPRSPSGRRRRQH